MSHEDELQLNPRTFGENELKALVAELDQLSAGAESPAVAPVTPANPFPAELKALIHAKAAELKADAYANGWTAKMWKAIDAWRVIHAEDYNAKRRQEYAIATLAKTGKLPRGYNKSPTADDRAEQVNGAQRRRRAAMTPEERSAESKKRSDRRIKLRQKKREEAGLPPRIEDHPNFGRF